MRFLNLFQVKRIGTRILDEYIKMKKELTALKWYKCECELIATMNFNCNPRIECMYYCCQEITLSLSMSSLCNWRILWQSSWSFSSSRAAFIDSSRHSSKSNISPICFLTVHFFLKSCIFLLTCFAWFYMQFICKISVKREWQPELRISPVATITINI